MALPLSGYTVIYIYFFFKLLYVENDFLLVNFTGDTQHQTFGETSMCNFWVTNISYIITLLLYLFLSPSPDTRIRSSLNHTMFSR